MCYFCFICYLFLQMGNDEIFWPYPKDYSIACMGHKVQLLVLLLSCLC